MANKIYDWYLKQYFNERWAFQTNLFTPQECKTIINTIIKNKKKYNFTESTVGNGEKQFESNADIRKSKVAFLPANDNDCSWIFQKITDSINLLNDQYFQFDIEKIETLQFSEYHSTNKGFYQRHCDDLYFSNFYRKLSFTIQLSDPTTYEGGELLLHTSTEPEHGKTECGSITIFPSYTLHEVTPVTKGVRYSLVGWVIGPKFK